MLLFTDLLLLFLISVCVCVFMSTSAHTRLETSDLPGAEVANGCEPLYMGTERQTQLKSSVRVVHVLNTKSFP